MKKRMISLALLCMATFALNAQDISDHAIGIRFGDNSGLGTEISYQRKIKESNRLELNLGTRSDTTVGSFKLAGVYQWVWSIDNGFNWYAGFGGGIGSWRNKVADTNEVVLFAAGNIGIEYSFDFPLQLSIDYRPEFGFSDIYDGLNSDFALSARYQF